ncbi:hypothetical protein ACQ4PT_064704 [Festuca glaucescens]
MASSTSTGGDAGVVGGWLQEVTPSCPAPASASGEGAGWVEQLACHGAQPARRGSSREREERGRGRSRRASRTRAASGASGQDRQELEVTRTGLSSTGRGSRSGRTRRVVGGERVSGLQLSQQPYKLLCGRTNEAEIQFEKLLGPLHVKSAMAELSRSERGDDGESVKYSELFYGRHFNVVFIGTTLFALQQLSGINSVFYFSSTVFRSVGVPSSLVNICMGIANLSGSVVAMLLMDRLGRKVLLAGSFFGMAFTMGLQAIGANRHHLGSASVYFSVGGILL